MRALVLVNVFLLLMLPSRGQSVLTDMEYTLRAHYGFVIVHSEAVRNVQNSYPFGIELNAARHINTESIWNTCNCYAKLGGGIAYFNYDNPDVLGYGLTALGFVEPTIQSGKPFHIGIRAGLGASYLSNPFDQQSNPDNQSYSTYLNFFVPLQFNFYYSLNSNWTLQLGANYNHHSNGGIRVPNKGINFPTASFGLEYQPKVIEFTNRLKQSINDRKVNYDFGVYAAQKQLSPERETKYLVSGLYALRSQQFAKLSAFTVGADYTFDKHLQEQQRFQGEEEDNPHRLALLGGHELLMGRFRFTQALGVYLWDPTRSDDPIYHRWALNIELFNNLFVELFIKAHRHIADHVAIRLGYRLKQ